MLRSWVFPPTPAVARPLDRRRGWAEVAIVFAITLGLSGIRSLISLIDDVLAAKPLAAQQVVIIATQARADLLDLFAQLAGVLQLLAWGALGIYLPWVHGIRTLPTTEHG